MCHTLVKLFISLYVGLRHLVDDHIQIRQEHGSRSHSCGRYQTGKSDATSQFDPTQITTRSPTNGDVTVAGTLWSGVGGMLMGALTVAMDAISGLAPLQFRQVTLYGGLCGLVGSFLDSLLGATLQVTYYDTETKLVYHHDPQTSSARRVCGHAILSNEQVNLVSVALTAYLGGWIIAPWFFGG